LQRADYPLVGKRVLLHLFTGDTPLRREV
jgi:hypothetical protein